MNEKFTQQESLEIITEMINQTRNNVRKGSGIHMVFWGYLIAAIALINIVLILILDKPNQSFMIWALTVSGIFGSRYLSKKGSEEAIVKTHIDSIISAVWRGFMWAIFIFIVMINCLAYFADLHGFALIMPVIFLMFGLAEYITAKACRFKPFLYGAYCIWVGALLNILAVIFLKGHQVYIAQLAVYAVCMILGSAIPGQILNKKAENHA